MPLLATWAEVGQFPDFPERKISFCHTFYGLSDGGALAFFGFADPDVYEVYKAKVQSGFNHIALAVSSELQDQIKQKLEKAGHRPYRVSTQGGREIGWFYKVPRAEFRWGTRLKRTGARKSSEASMAALAAHRARRQKPVEPEFP